MGILPKMMCEIHSIGARTKERMVGTHGVPALAGFGIQLAGISEAKAGFAWTRLNPPDTQLLITIAGEEQLLFNNEWRQACPGTAYLTPSGAPHAYRALPRKNWTLCWVLYSGRPKDLSEFLSDSPQILSIFSKQLWYALDGACDAAAHQESPAQMELWARLIHQTVQRALKRASQTEEHEQRLASLWKAVAADLARPWTLDGLASAAGMSKENLRRVCQQELNRSPMRQLARLRFQRAGELLADNSNKIISVAERIGYSDPFTFSVAFKREMGVPPSDYRSPVPVG